MRREHSSKEGQDDCQGGSARGTCHFLAIFLITLCRTAACLPDTFRIGAYQNFVLGVTCMWPDWRCCDLQVSDRDDKLLTEQLLDLEKANQEVAGDDDSEEEEVGMGDLDVDAV